jgi:nickel-dependent lactate racemase
MVYLQQGSEHATLSREEIRSALHAVLERLGNRKRVLVIPPDITRFHSMGGLITEMIWDYFGNAVADILPALGTHAPMTDDEIGRMFGRVDRSLFRVHDWRNDVITLGEVPPEYIRNVSDGALDFSWPAQVNRLLVDGGHDLIISTGQVVPHEVIGMANYNKNIFVGTGGSEGINKSHFLGAVYGMEKIMGRADNPVRSVLNYAEDHFASNLPVLHVLTVIGRDTNGELVPRGLFIGDDKETFYRAAELSLKVNFEMVSKPLDKVVVYLDPAEYRSTWLGNKSIYRTRMAIADGGELIILAPGLKEFGEDREIDRLIRQFGYRTTPEILDFTRSSDDLRANLSAAAHLIHGSTENRFNVTYCPGHLSREEVEAVNYRYGDLSDYLKKYDPSNLKDGWNRLSGGEEVYFISNPATGLWSTKDKFQ